MADPIRIQVEDLRGNSRVVTVEPSPDPRVHDAIDAWLAATAEATGLHPETIALHAITELVERHHDRAAYEREAARRGVLAL